MASSSYSHYATYFMLVCVAIMAATAPSAANIVRMVNVNGALICANTGLPAAPNVTVSLVCSSTLSPIGVVLEATTSATGTISASINVGSRTGNAISSTSCLIIAPPQICSSPINATLGASVTVTISRNTATVTPASQLGPLPRSATSN